MWCTRFNFSDSVYRTEHEERLYPLFVFCHSNIPNMNDSGPIYYVNEFEFQFNNLKDSG